MPLVVGSVGPYGAHLHDGSEYDGSYADTTSVEVRKLMSQCFLLDIFENANLGSVNSRNIDGPTEILICNSIFILYLVAC